MTTTDPMKIRLNQSNLQDFLDCPRRFELKTIQDASWPAALSEPPSRYEIATDLGNDFHMLANQFFIGMDPNTIVSSIQDPTLEELWSNFLPYATTLLTHDPYPEQILRTSLASNILVAKYDLIVLLADSTFLIIDWKTGSKKPERQVLADRVQTYLYPFIFYEAYQDLFQSSQPAADQIVFQYWYPLASEPEESFSYSALRHQKVRDRLSSIINDIEDLVAQSAPFPLTEDIRMCRFCNFRSFCERGTFASPLSPTADYENEDLSNTQFDINMIEEIEF